MQSILVFIVNHWILSLAFVLLLGFLLGLEFSSQLSSIRQLTPQQVIDIINKEGGVLIDVREREEFRNGHIANALNTPSKEFEENITQLEVYKPKPIIVTCNVGQTSNTFAHKLRELGFSNVNNLKGGLAEWRNAGLPIIKSSN